MIYQHKAAQVPWNPRELGPVDFGIPLSNELLLVIINQIPLQVERNGLARCYRIEKLLLCWEPPQMESVVVVAYEQERAQEQSRRVQFVL